MPHVFWMATACLFLSGLAGLIYEVVWARYLALFLGHTSYAVVAVLVAFMGGLALGNLWLGRWADRTRRPLAFYAWLEVGIGLYALLFPAYYELCHSLFLSLARHWQPGSLPVLAGKFGFSLLTILGPTVLMGGTLPLLTRAVSGSLGELRTKVAALYFVNSAGAVAGAWLADFWLLEASGLRVSLVIAAAVNLAAGGLALLASRALEGEGKAERPQSEAPPAPVAAGEGILEVFSPGELRLAVVAIGLSGFVAMLYQVAWTRLLALVIGSSTHAFGLMLITFIAGIAVGSWLLSRWRGQGDSLRTFGRAEVALAVLVGLSLLLYQYLPYWFMLLAGLVARDPAAYWFYQLLQGTVCFAVMFPPTVCLGMTLPLASRVATAELGQAGRAVGRVFAVNTLGTVLGAAATGLVLMPWLGLARTFAIGVGLNLLIGLAVLLRRHWPARRWWLLVGAGTTLAWALTLGQHLGGLWPQVHTLGLWRGAAPRSWAHCLALAKEADLVYYRDGAGATVSVGRGGGTNRNLYLKVNGKTDASSTGDMRTQLLLGHVPMLLHPRPRRALVIGLGSGTTAGAVAAHPTLETLEVVELLPEVAQAARRFAAFNRHVLEEPRLRLHLEDANSFLRLADRQYDVVISEPSNPWMAGVAGIFTVEFYQHCRAHLAPGGLMVQWVHVYEFSDASLDVVVKTFVTVFPHLAVWQSLGGDLLLVGSVLPLQADLDAMAARLALPAVRADLERGRLANLPLLLSQEMIAGDVAPFLPPEETPVHSDYRPVLEYAAQRDFFARTFARRFRELDESLSPRPATLLGQYLKRHPLKEEDFSAFRRDYEEPEVSDRSAEQFGSVLLRWQQDAPAATAPLELLARSRRLIALGPLEAARLGPQRARIAAEAAQRPGLERDYALALMQAYREQRSAFYLPPAADLQAVLSRLAGVKAEGQRLWLACLAELAWDRGDDDACLELGQQALGPGAPRGSTGFELDPEALWRAAAHVADLLARRGQLEEAASLCESARRAGQLKDRWEPPSLRFEVVARQVRQRLKQQYGL